MNNNRNNRRRGRGNRNQGGNGAQLNRIDSRARGNAPQMLDKYKKLAQDAQHNGDRVQMEYYLQFADHYFRVIADNKARADEQRGGRRSDEREQSEDFSDDDLDFDRGRRSERPIRQRQDESESFVAGDVEEGEPGQEGESFLADTPDDDRDDTQQRSSGTRRQRKPRDGGREGGRDENRGDRQERGEKRGDKPARGRKPRKSADDGAPTGIDSSILPPSIRGDDAGGDSGALETVD
ncbi:hypothetical protein CHX26_01685 [Porphyrobacter sp. HT-58-2]|uniref:DUF4167 domain-containing protein n=1 Tax=Porphyrobacter sp. HT-58-2 TaxID=2023229 RepID=UPI000CDC2D60|nr:DUF4167 domain-containing protein [Porphyrobacter sp. HT-58-2]AUX68399.1 hypothetical protein CHX26_01685 [Porphyrobacter sp. HT-58-2]